MSKKMLIDATHPEETRVVVVDGTRVEEFDFETINKRQLAGNIYLAKVTRVEPSLQAAFVDYGGNRHGFLAFAEIHPDYYQIPLADRQALMEEERAAAAAAEAEENSERRQRRRRGPKPERMVADEVVKSDQIASSDATGDFSVTEIPGMEISEPQAEGEPQLVSVVETATAAQPCDDDGLSSNGDDAGDDRSDSENGDDHDDGIESIADEDVTEEVTHHHKKPRQRRYKIQEVIKVRQIMLVQVVKEERGNKGAALTTYLSLAGRYCVLMPNTARGGGISRKITNAVDRKKLKEIASELSVPQGAGLIIRTAGSQRTRSEIRRDYEYLMRLWEQIRELTFRSTAPAPVYEEGDLIKRTIRDIYSKEIDEVLVEGERGYRTAKDFMKMIMPSHAKNVKHYTDAMPLYARFQVESYLTGMFNPTVQLKSGGYIVIGVTEALVAIDVNSGRATKEGSIEDTAYKTNCEAADEIARQLRLRDLAGLIVVDFIDMEERKNNASVEKRFKDKLKTDRARIQVGRISGFGLLEMSRQRLRPGMLESTTQPCAHCHGTGLIRSDDSLALTILRAIEEEGTRKRSREVLVKAPIAVANFLMNAKREHIAGIEARYGMAVRVEADPSLISPDFTLEKFKTATRFVPEVVSPVVSVDARLMAQIDGEDEPEIEDEDEAANTAADSQALATGSSDETSPEDGDGNGKSKRRRRRRRRGGRNGDATSENGSDDNGSDENDSDDGDSDSTGAEAEVAVAVAVAASQDAVIASEASVSHDSAEGADADEGKGARKPRRAPRSRRKPASAEAAATDTPAEPAVTEAAVTEAGVAEAAGAKGAVAEARAETAETKADVAAPAVAQPQESAVAPVAADEAPAPAQVSSDVTPVVSDPSQAVAAPVIETAPEAAVEAAAKPAVAPAASSDETPSSQAAPKPELAEVSETAAAPAAPQPKRRGWWSA
ncbi:Rne/Rng family ribonuclease [Paracoccus sp. (in: a-proteobacteria)]|uniref:Rne/Rng family ribonuclease n=1 Tax=Paracoccus sp. TaxID=267 RepID=UPI00289EA2D8|nr:Rne/Rng family ribonuclease [Paracoccus sp. (in: a-proteobacteria)]